MHSHFKEKLLVAIIGTLISCCAATPRISEKEVLIGGNKYHMYVDEVIPVEKVSWIIERLTYGEYRLVDSYGKEYDSERDEKKQRITKRIHSTNWGSPLEIYNCVIDEVPQSCRFPRKLSEENGYYISFRSNGGFHWGIIWIVDGELLVSYWGEGIVSDSQTKNGFMFLRSAEAFGNSGKTISFMGCERESSGTAVGVIDEARDDVKAFPWAVDHFGLFYFTTFTGILSASCSNLRKMTSKPMPAVTATSVTDSNWILSVALTTVASGSKS